MGGWGPSTRRATSTRLKCVGLRPNGGPRPFSSSTAVTPNMHDRASASFLSPARRLACLLLPPHCGWGSRNEPMVREWKSWPVAGRGVRRLTFVATNVQAPRELGGRRRAPRERGPSDHLRPLARISRPFPSSTSGVVQAPVDGSGGERSGLVGGVDVNEEAFDARNDVGGPYGWHGIEGVLAAGDLGVDDGRA
jgi:hypothetical protein